MTKGAKLLKIYRFTNDLTQKDFSQKYNVHRSTIASIESNNTQPKIETAKLLGKIINIDWWLFYEDEKKD